MITSHSIGWPHSDDGPGDDERKSLTSHDVEYKRFGLDPDGNPLPKEKAPDTEEVAE